LEIESAAFKPSAFAELLEPVVKSLPPEASESALPSVTVVGKLAAVSPSGVPFVDFPENPEGQLLSARRVCVVTAVDVGREAVLVFENNDRRRPILLGLLQPASPSVPRDGEAQCPKVSVDGEEIALTAKKEIVLRCGEASIRLTRAGKVLIRGTYVLSRASAMNRVKGGSVQIN